MIIKTVSVDEIYLWEYVSWEKSPESKIFGKTNTGLYGKEEEMKMRFYKETEKKQFRKLDESQERITSQKPTQENFRKNVVNTVNMYRKTEKTAKGSGS